MPDRTITYLPVEELPEASRNAKGHDIDAIGRSIRQFGFTAPAIIDERTGRLVAGHGRREALLEMAKAGEDPPDGVTTDDEGRWSMPVVRGWASRDDEHADAVTIADNRGTERGGWDQRMLAEILEELADASLLEAAGYDATDLEDMLAAVGPPPSLDDLAEEYGEPEDSDLWPVLRFKVPPDIRQAFYDLTADAVPDDDTSRFLHLINQARQA